MTPTQIAELEAEFIRRAHADKDAGHELNASTWQLAASLLIGAASNASAPLLTSKEIAPILKVSWQTVTRWKIEGRIPAAIDEPGCLRFDLAEVRAALASRATPTPTVAA